MADLFKLSFMNGVFPTAFKIAEVVPGFKKDSELVYGNYHSICLISNIQKTLE